MNYKILLLIGIIFLTAPGIFSHVVISPDPLISQDTIYLSKNVSKSYNFEYDTDYSSSLTNSYRAEYDLKVYSNNLQEIKLSLSKQEEVFISKVGSSFSLNIRSLDFTDQTINLRIKVSIYDPLDNLVDDGYIFLKIISNNSEYDFLEDPKNKVPEYKGYSLSRDKMFILNYLDKDKIVIKNHVDYSLAYDVDCFSENKDLVLDLRYVGNNEHTLEVSIDNNSVQENVFYVSCYAFNKEDVHDIKTITVNYLDQNLTDFSPEVTIEKEDVKENKFKTFFQNIYNKLI